MCTDWTVARVLGHLGSQAEIGLAGWEANVAGREPPGPEANPPIWERWNAMPPREAATAFADADRRLLEALEGLDADQLDTMQIKLAFLPEPIDVASAVGFRLGEHALHSWDVFAAFDDRRDPRGRRHRAADRPAPDDGRHDRTVHATRHAPGRSGHDLGRDVEPFPAATPSSSATTVELRPADRADGYDGDLAIPSEALLRLTSGRLRPDRPSGDVEPSGALSLADLRRAFPGY